MRFARTRRRYLRGDKPLALLLAQRQLSNRFGTSRGSFGQIFAAGITTLAESTNGGLALRATVIARFRGGAIVYQQIARIFTRKTEETENP